MQAVRARFTAPYTLRFQSFDLPDRAAPGRLLLELERTIISAGTELANYTGLEPGTHEPGGWASYPWTPGYGGVGRVIDVGDGLDGYSVGDRIFGIFNHATHAVVDPRSSLAVRVPPGLAPERAAFTRMACVAITGYHRATVTMGDSVLVIGLGLVGNLCGQFFALNGQTVIGLDPAAHRRELADRCGFAAALDPATDLPERIAALSHGRGARVAIDAVGHSPLVGQAIDLVAKWGQVILLGTPRADDVVNWTPWLRKVHWNAIDVKGALEWTYPLLKRADLGAAVTIEGNAERILEWIAAGRLAVDPLLSHQIAPAGLDDAYRGLLDRKDEYLGVVVDWTCGAPEPDGDA